MYVLYHITYISDLVMKITCKYFISSDAFLIFNACDILYLFNFSLEIFSFANYSGLVN